MNDDDNEATDALELLEQEVIWREPDGRSYYVGELTDEQLGAALALLNRHVGSLFQRRCDHDEFEAPPRALRHVHRWATGDEHEWLHSRPLYRALLKAQRARAAGRRYTLERSVAKIMSEYGDALRRLEDL